MSLLGIDIGSSGCKAVAFSKDGQVVHGAYRPYETNRDIPGQAELDIMTVVQSVFDCIREASAHCGSDPIQGLAVTSLGEACIPAKADGSPAMAACVMPEDSRAGADADRLMQRFGSDEIFRRTSVAPAGCFSLPLLSRLFRDNPQLKGQTRWLLSWTDYIAFLLSGVAACNTSSASRTLAYDVHTSSWIEEYIEAAGLDCSWFPPLVSPGACLGPVLPERATQLGLNGSVQVFAGCHDQCAAAAGAGAASESDLMLGLGTYACALFCRKAGTPPQVAYGTPMNIEPHVFPGTYASYLYHGACGGLNRWLRDVCGTDLKQRENPFDAMFDEITDWTPRPLPVMLPDFGSSKGVLANLNFGHTRSDILLGAWMSNFFFFRETTMAAAKQDGLKRIIVSGGCAKVRQLLQLAANVFQLPVVLNDTKETGALGCAMMAGTGVGVYSSMSEAARTVPRKLQEYMPQQDCAEAYDAWRQVWDLHYPQR